MTLYNFDYYNYYKLCNINEIFFCQFIWFISYEYGHMCAYAIKNTQ